MYDISREKPCHAVTNQHLALSVKELKHKGGQMMHVLIIRTAVCKKARLNVQ